MQQFEVRATAPSEKCGPTFAWRAFGPTGGLHLGNALAFCQLHIPNGMMAYHSVCSRQLRPYVADTFGLRLFVLQSEPSTGGDRSDVGQTNSGDGEAVCYIMQLFKGRSYPA